MSVKILIDLTKFRVPPEGESCDHPPVEAIFYPSQNTNGFKTIREQAVFRFTCRKCEDAPCIAVCPSDALEKDEEGVITRSTNLCISCKSCVTICPFGTMMTDFFKHHLRKENYFDLTDKSELDKFIKACPNGAVSLVEIDENPENHIYKLNDKVLIKDFMWDSSKM